jgi:hypothetical protein
LPAAPDLPWLDLAGLLNFEVLYICVFIDLDRETHNSTPPYRLSLSFAKLLPVGAALGRAQ